MHSIASISHNPPACKGWDDFDREIEAAFDAEVEQALKDIGHPARFDEVAERLPDGIPYAWILNSLRAVAECHDRRWRIRASAAVVALPGTTSTTTTRKAA